MFAGLEVVTRAHRPEDKQSPASSGVAQGKALRVYPSQLAAINEYTYDYAECTH